MINLGIDSVTKFLIELISFMLIDSLILVLFVFYVRKRLLFGKRDEPEGRIYALILLIFAMLSFFMLVLPELIFASYYIKHSLFVLLVWQGTLLFIEVIFVQKPIRLLMQKNHGQDGDLKNHKDDSAKNGKNT